MKRRRVGQETEYAVRRPHSGDSKSTDGRSNHSLFLLIRGYITDHCLCLPGYRDFYQSQFFTESGGAFAYEALPTAERDGLIEGATPECLTPYELLCHQRAQEAWLIQALASQRIQNDQAFQGCGLLKNCRDAEGHIYGSQENYEAEIGNSFWLFAYRLVVCIAIPVTFVGTIGMLLVLLTLIFVFGLLGLISGTLSFSTGIISKIIPRAPFIQMARWIKSLNEKAIARITTINEDQAAQIANLTLFPFLFALLSPFAWLLSHITFRNVRRGMTGFLISRGPVTGAGCLLDEKTFVFSEKGSALRSNLRNWATMASRSLYDSGNLLKGVHLASLDFFVFRRTNWLFLLHRHQRLQIGCSDANRCDVAEYLKIGTTMLIVEMAEAGQLRHAPLPYSVVAAQKQINHDTGLKAKIKMKGGTELTAMEIQRWYQKEAQLFVSINPSLKEVYQPVLDRWLQVLDTLEWDPEQLIGQLDWVTKKSLIEEAGKDQSFDVKKRMDLGYHELGSGYFEIFSAANLVTKIVKPEDLQRAIKTPPSSRSSQLRSRFIKSNQSENTPWTVGWQYAIRGRFRRQSRRVFDRPS
jgi:Pup amidohydrolase